MFLWTNCPGCVAHLCWGKSAQHRGVAKTRLKEAQWKVEGRDGATSF